MGKCNRPFTRPCPKSKGLQAMRGDGGTVPVSISAPTLVPTHSLTVSCSLSPLHSTTTADHDHRPLSPHHLSTITMAHSLRRRPPWMRISNAYPLLIISDHGDCRPVCGLVLCCCALSVFESAQHTVYIAGGRGVSGHTKCSWVCSE